MMHVNRLRQQSLNQISSHSLLIGKLGSGFAIVVGSLVMFGWWFNLEVFKNCFNLSQVTMKGNTALCFVLLGISLWLSIKSREDSNIRVISGQIHKHSYSLLLARVCAFTVFTIGTLILTQYLFGWNFGIDQLLFLEEENPRLTFQPGRMGLNTAVNFILISKALELLGKSKTHRSIWYGQILALFTAVISLLALIGYAYQVEALYGILPHVTSMALHTAVTFTVLCVGILWLQPQQGVMQIVTSQTYSGLLARRLLLAAFAVPLATGWLILQGQRAKHYDTAFALALFAIISIVIFAILIWETASSVQRLANQRDRVKEVLKTNSEKLRRLVEANVIGILYGDIYGGIQQANDKFLQMIGYSRKDLKAGKISWKQMTPPEYLDIDAQKIAEAQINGACTPYEKEYIRRDGNRIPVLVGYTLVGNKREESVAFILDLSAHKQAQAALIQSEERFRLAVDHMPDVFAIYDAQRRFQFVNAAALQLFGKLKEEIIGRRDEEIFPTKVTESYLGTLIQAVETRTIQTTEARITFPERGVLTTSIKYVPILDNEGKIYQILAFAEDITIRKQAEEVQKNQQKWLEDVLNLMPTPLLLIEPGTAQVTFANKAANEVAGGKFPMADSATDYHTLYYSTDANGNPIPDEQAPGIRVARGERLDGVELDWHSPVGIRSLLIYADTLPAMHGHSATCVLTFQDITNLKRVEKALSLGYKRLHLLFSTASDLLSSQEPLTLIESLFRKLSEQIGLDVYFNYLVDENSQLMHLASWCGIDEESAKEIECLRVGMGMCGTVAQQRLPIAVENVQQSTDTKSEFLRGIGVTAYYGYPLMAQGRLLGTLCFISRTRLKFTQNEMGMMQAVCDQVAIAMERASLISSLQQQTEQLQEANRMKDEFLAILSHELRSPLNAILGWSQLLRSRSNLNETQIHKALETIERNARAQTQLIDDLLDISRIIRGKLRLNVRTCDLINIIETALDTVNLAAQTKNIQIQTILDPTAAVISGDAERLQQVVWNLLSNAIKFTPPGGRVEVKLSGASDWEMPDPQSPITNCAQIAVKDTGIGISSDFLPYVFDRFRQADSSITRSYGGLGLGLAIVRHLVEMHGGTIHVESPGKEQGTTFIVNLPLLKTEQPIVHTQESIVNSPSFSLTPSLTPCLSGVRVLVVDDEADTRDFLTTVLQESQAEVQAVASVQEALAAIERYKPDVLVSDIGMPQEDGYSLIRHLRSQPPEKGGKIPAAALTAYARAEDRRQAIQAGFQLHMPKPVDPSELVTVVASLVERNT
ncbi:PAS domain S-box protein [Chlorogloeopsis sp. ULAP02]|uniref:PAS domain S-box protein n=1 Tax=Chlorogloeopsis sp. ULAP02 TaxID=3107926 RepID=UPI003137422F